MAMHGPGHNRTLCRTSGPYISSLCTILQRVFTPLLTVNSDTHQQSIGIVSNVGLPEHPSLVHAHCVIREDTTLLAHLLSVVYLLVVCTMHMMMMMMMIYWFWQPEAGLQHIHTYMQ